MNTDQVKNKADLCSIAPFQRTRSLVVQLPYRIIEDRSAYHILIKIKRLSASSLSCSLNYDERKVILTARSGSQQISSEIAALIFQVPLDANLNELRVQSREDAYLISIPKNEVRLKIASSMTIYM